MTEPYFWHYHPNLDETFMTVDGILVIELETETDLFFGYNNLRFSYAY